MAMRPAAGDDEPGVGKSAPVVALGLALLLAGCGGRAGAGAGSVTERYERAIVSRDGDALCATFAPKLREVLEEQIAEGRDGGPRYHCGSFYHLLIGYPHENTDRQFLSGELLRLGTPRRVTRDGVVYAKVPASLRFRFSTTGYSMGKRGQGAATFGDTVWLTQGKDGSWGVVKPSLALDAASSPDVLFEQALVSRVNAPPPDPDYSMTRKERTASEAADYRASFRRSVGHAPLRCGGGAVSAADPLGDVVTYPTGSTLHPAPTAGGNDIERAAVRVSGARMCVAVTFHETPAGPLRVGLVPDARHVFFPEYIVQLDHAGRVRAGGLTVRYRYFRGGERLTRDAVDEVSLHGRMLEFAADAGIAHGVSGTVPADLAWVLRSEAATGSDQVPNEAPGAYLRIRQSDGRTVGPRR